MSKASVNYRYAVVAVNGGEQNDRRGDMALILMSARMSETSDTIMELNAFA